MESSIGSPSSLGCKANVSIQNPNTNNFLPAKKVIWCTYRSNFVAFHDLATPEGEKFDGYFQGTQLIHGKINHWTRIA